MRKHHVPAVCHFWVTAHAMAQVKTGADASACMCLYRLYNTSKLQVFYQVQCRQFFPKSWSWGKAGCRKDSMMLMCCPVAVKQDGGSSGGQFVSMQRRRVSREEQGFREPEWKACCRSTKQELNRDSPELCDRFLYLCAVAEKELVPKRQGRGCACHVEMQQGTEAGRMLMKLWPAMAL